MKSNHLTVVGLRCDAEKIPLENETFECYISNLCIHLQEDPLPMLKEAYRLLRPHSKAGFAIWGHKKKCKMFNLLEDVLDEMNIAKSNIYEKIDPWKLGSSIE